MKNKLVCTLSVITLAACGARHDREDPARRSPSERGERGLPGEIGPMGPAGPSGPSGESGHAGSGCSVNQVPTGAEINCPDGSSVTVSNGQNGSDGQDGADGQDAPVSPFAITGIEDPCGDAPGIIDEVFLRLSNGWLVVLFADNAAGNNPRLSIVPPGSYRTTDGSNCYFTVDSNYDIINEHY